MLLIYVYFLRGASLLIDAQRTHLSQAEAIGLSLSLVVGSWLIYDLLIWNARLVKARAISVVLSVFFFGGLVFELFQLFSGRGAFILTGAIFGSMMLMNVWVRILPGQAKMVREAQAGQTPDYSVSLKSKVRSVHNTYFIFPVLFIMLSNHYPLVYNHPQNWLLLIILSVSGALVRHAMVTKNPVERWTLLPAAIGLGALVFATIPLAPKLAVQAPGRIEFAQVQSVVQRRCLACHSSANTDDIYKEAPHGVKFETEEQIRNRAMDINLHVVLAKSMPLGNKTQMTDAERETIAQWLTQEGLVRKPESGELHHQDKPITL